MDQYKLPHDLAGEQQRLAVMSALLDPVEQVHIARLGVRPGRRCLELGCGNGSIARALAERVAPTGHVVASDIDLAYIVDLQAPCLEVRQIDILHDAIEEGCYDFVVARALLHHLTPAGKALERMVAALKPGGVLLSIEPDMLPCTVTAPDSMRGFWQGWLKWSGDAGIYYFIGRKISAWLDALGLKDVGGEGYTAGFNGGSAWATYWTETIQELAASLEKSGCVTSTMLDEFSRPLSILALLDQRDHLHRELGTQTGLSMSEVPYLESNVVCGSCEIKHSKTGLVAAAACLKQLPEAISSTAKYYSP